MEPHEDIQHPSLPNFIIKIKDQSLMFSEEKLNYFNNELASYLKVFIIGYPCDIGASNCSDRTGSEKGSNNFREILDNRKTGTDNAEFKVNLSQCKLKIFDCGNI